MYTSGLLPGPVPNITSSMELLHYKNVTSQKEEKREILSLEEVPYTLKTTSLFFLYFVSSLK